MVGLIDGVRESAQSWKELQLHLKGHGLGVAIELAVAEGALALRSAIEGSVAADSWLALPGTHKIASRAEQTAEEPAVESQAAAGDLGGKKPRRRP